jgi:hypothetical protein
MHPPPLTSSFARQGGLDGPALSCSRVEVPGGPAFSLHRGIRTKVTDANVKPREPVLFCGLASKEIVALRPDSNTFSEQVWVCLCCAFVLGAGVQLATVLLSAYALSSHTH